MTHALRRLRELLDDPLLVRGKSGMVPALSAARLNSPTTSAMLS